MENIILLDCELTQGGSSDFPHKKKSTYNINKHEDPQSVTLPWFKLAIRGTNEHGHYGAIQNYNGVWNRRTMMAMTVYVGNSERLVFRLGGAKSENEQIVPKDIIVYLIWLRNLLVFNCIYYDLEITLNLQIFYFLSFVGKLLRFLQTLNVCIRPRLNLENSRKGQTYFINLVLHKQHTYF